MRFLKSFVLLLCLTARLALAQDTAISARDKTPAFHADKVSAVVQLKERPVPESTLQRLRNDETFWYANTTIKKPLKQPQQESLWQWLFGQAWFYYLMWALILGSFIAVMLLFLFKSNIQLFHKASTPIEGINNSGSTETVLSINFDDALQTAVAAADFHVAVRLQYLQVLAMLSSKNLIQYKDDFTNSDYLQQLQATSYYEPFKKLTHHFEYAWYGKFDLTHAAYERIASDFNRFKTSMSI